MTSTPGKIARLKFYNKRVMGIKAAITEAVKEEREECAKVAYDQEAYATSAAIRARGKAGEADNE